MYTSAQVLNGITNYAEKEIIAKLPTAGKWIIGAGIGMAMQNIQKIITDLGKNETVKMLGVVDENGNIDVDSVTQHLKESAKKYGKMRVQIPILGEMTFSDEDIEMVKKYIEEAR